MCHVFDRQKNPDWFPVAEKISECHVFDRSMHRTHVLRLTDMVYRSPLPPTIIHD
jgi:hypothetical protein